MRDLFALLALTFSAVAQTAAPAGAESLLARGNELFEKQLFAEAASEYQHALAVSPGLKSARYQLAVCLFALGRNDESQGEFGRLVKEIGATHEIEYYMGRLHLLSGDYAAAIRELTPLIGHPKMPAVPYYLALAYVAHGDQVAGLKWLERAANTTPRDYHVHYRLARLYMTAGRKSDSEREYRLYNQYRDVARDTEIQLRACAAALDQGDGSQVCARLNDPNDPERLVLLGQMYGSHGAFAQALEPLLQAAKLDPASFEAWQNLGISYFRLQRYREARQPLEKALALRPDNFDSLNLLAATLYMLNDDAAALPVVERAHRMRPDDAQLAAALKRLREAQAEKK